jgi:hypothetical protein
MVHSQVGVFALDSSVLAKEARIVVGFGMRISARPPPRTILHLNKAPLPCV